MADIDPAAKIQAIAAREKAKRQDDQARAIEASNAKTDREAAQREAMRAAMPEVAAVVDQFREVFGDVVVVSAEENGRLVRAERSLKALGLL